MSVVAYADLHGFGAREGVPVVHTWEAPPPEPPEPLVTARSSLRLLVWGLILLPLFLLRQNRSSEAWWIWVPALISALAGAGITWLMDQSDWTVPQAACALTVGLTAMWLLMPWLQGRYRLLSFVLSLLILSLVSLLAFLPTLLGPRSSWLDFRPFIAAALALASLAILLALSFASRTVRRRFGRVRFLVQLALWMLAAWTAIATPFVIISSRTSQIDWEPSLLALLFLSGISLLLLVPFVLLSYFQPFYRDRFFAFFNLAEGQPPAGPAAPPVLPGRVDGERETVVGGPVN